MHLLVRVFRALSIWAFTAAYWSFQLGGRFLCFRRVDPDEAALIIRRWGVHGLKIAGIRLCLENPCPYLDRVEPRLIICNHPSALDLLWGAVICPPRPLAIGKKELIWIPVINWVWWMLRFRRIDRRDHQKAVESLREIPKLIVKNGLSLIMAPEGTRSKDGSIGPFKKGPFHIAIGAQAPVYPIVVSGAYELMPRTAWLPRSGTVRLKFLNPVSTQGMTEKDAPVLAERCRQAMVAELALMTARAQTLH